MIGLLSALPTEEERENILYVYKNHYGDMFRVAYSVVKNREVANDIVHDAMLRLIKNSSAIRIDGKFPLKTYVVTVVKNVAIDYLRIQIQKEILDIDECTEEIENMDTFPSALEIVLDGERYGTLVQCIKELPDSYKGACYLKYVCSLEVEEIAMALSISEKNAMMRLFRGRKLLMDRIAEVSNHE